MDFSHPNAQPFLLEAGENAVLLIHGFTGSPSHMRTIGEAAHAAGFTASGILLPGHGTSIEDMEKSGGNQWLDAVRQAMVALQKRYTHVAVGGLSMGGILAMLAAEELNPSALLLFAPALRYSSIVNYASPMAKHFLKVSKWKPHDFSETDFLKDYDFGYRGAPVKMVEEMTALQRQARRGMARITCPTLVMQSHRDESVHRTVPERITRGISSKVKEISWVDQSSHVLTIGPDRMYVNERVVDFLQRYGV